METLERIGFTYDFDLLDEDGGLLLSESCHNLMPDEGIHYMLGAAFCGHTQWPKFYIGLTSGTYNPTTIDTAATYIQNATEFVGYEGQTRLEVDFSQPVSCQISNTQNQAVFTFNQSGSITGAFLITSPAKGSGGGLLVSATRLPSPIPVSSGQTLSVLAGIIVQQL